MLRTVLIFLQWYFFGPMPERLDESIQFITGTGDIRSAKTQRNVFKSLKCQLNCAGACILPVMIIIFIYSFATSNGIYNL